MLGWAFPPFLSGPSRSKKYRGVFRVPVCCGGDASFPISLQRLAFSGALARYDNRLRIFPPKGLVQEYLSVPQSPVHLLSSAFCFDLISPYAPRPSLVLGSHVLLYRLSPGIFFHIGLVRLSALIA